jgi:tetratricopeptide (TPR) repeat protein/DNA-binding CsgD family transcriptional regulator
MKTHNQHILLCIVTILSLFACNPQREASNLLQQAQKLADTQPDVALQLIDSIFYPERSLRKREYMSYLVTRVQARHRNHLPIDEDTFIFKTRDYFAERNNDPRQTALAFFYSGIVYREQGDTDNVMINFKWAAEYAARTDDADLKGMIQYNIGSLLAQEGRYKEAMKEFKKAESFFANSPDNAAEKQARSLVTIGRMHSLLGQQDGAFAAFRKGLELARHSQNNELLRLLNQNIHINYFQTGEYERAEEFLRQSLELNIDTTNLPRYYLNFAQLFTNTSQADSLAVYVDKLKQVVEQSDDLYFKLAAYHFLAANAKANNDFNAAFIYQDKEMGLVEKITQNHLEQSAYEAGRRYDYQRHQDKYTQALLQRQRQTIALLAFLLAISLLAIFMYRRMLQQKNRMLNMQNALTTLTQINESLQRDKQVAKKNYEKSKDTLEQMINRLQKDTQIAKESQEELTETFRQTIKDIQQDSEAAKKTQTQLDEISRWKFDIYRQTTFLQSGSIYIKSIDDAKEKFNEIVFGEKKPLYHKVFAEIVDIIYPDLSILIREKYPKFTDTELNISLLLFAGLEAKEISSILNLKNNTLNMKRTDIRKKMNLAERANFCAVLKKMYQESINAH